LAMAQKVPGWLERVLLPQLSELKGEIKALDARIGGFESKIEGEFKAIHSEIRRLDEKIDGLDERLSSKMEELDKRLDVTQRLAVVEGKVSELESRR